MSKTLVVCGYGPGISNAVARRFGESGFAVALVARSADKVAQAARSLGEAGIRAQGFACDLADPSAVQRMIGQVRDALGPVAVIHWNASAPLAGDLTSAPIEDLRTVLDVGVIGLVAAVQKALPDLRANKGAVLITGGGFSLYDERVDRLVAQVNAMGLAVSKAAQHKLAGALHHKLAPEGIYVGEVVVLGAVKGTAFDTGNATIDPARVADRFWELAQKRTEVSVQIGG
jgi:NADP-dependent 3-hydroxy acid dehydrogenase YdfG